VGSGYICMLCGNTAPACGEGNHVAERPSVRSNKPWGVWLERTDRKDKNDGTLLRETMHHIYHIYLYTRRRIKMENNSLGLSHTSSHHHNNNHHHHHHHHQKKKKKKKKKKKN
jgi:hypothetical protein